jgi:hypothetical protein
LWLLGCVESELMTKERGDEVGGDEERVGDDEGDDGDEEDEEADEEDEEVSDLEVMVTADGGGAGVRLIAITRRQSSSLPWIDC